MGRMTEDQEREIRTELARLREDHRNLDAAIAAVASAKDVDPVQLQRLKKRKLALKDRISRLEDGLLPDIIA